MARKKAPLTYPPVGRRGRREIGIAVGGDWHWLAQQLIDQLGWTDDLAEFLAYTVGQVPREYQGRLRRALRAQIAQAR